MKLSTRLTKREKYLIVVLLVAIWGFLYFKLVHLPEGRRFAALRHEYNQKLSLLDSVNNKQERIKEIDEKIRLLDAEISQKKGMLSQPLFVPDMLMDLHRQALKYNVAVDNIAFSGSASDIKGDLPGTQGSIAGPEAPEAEGAFPVVGPKAEGNLSTLKDLAISFSFSAGYEDLLSLIRYFEEGQRYAIVEILDVRNSEGALTGSMTVKIYGLN